MNVKIHIRTNAYTKIHKIPKKADANKHTIDMIPTVSLSNGLCGMSENFSISYSSNHISVIHWSQAASNWSASAFFGRVTV